MKQERNPKEDTRQRIFDFLDFNKSQTNINASDKSTEYILVPKSCFKWLQRLLNNPPTLGYFYAYLSSLFFGLLFCSLSILMNYATMKLIFLIISGLCFLVSLFGVIHLFIIIKMMDSIDKNNISTASTLLVTIEEIQPYLIKPTQNSSTEELPTDKKTANSA